MTWVDDGSFIKKPKAGLRTDVCNDRHASLDICTWYSGDNCVGSFSQRINNVLDIACWNACGNDLRHVTARAKENGGASADAAGLGYHAAVGDTTGEASSWRDHPKTVRGNEENPK